MDATANGRSTRAEQAQREEQRKARAATFERILENAPETLNAIQLRVLLRAIVNLDPYTFADDLAEEVADENESRIAEEVLLATIDATEDDKLTRFAIRLALSGHVGIPRENEFDFLAEADAVFAPPRKKVEVSKAGKAPVVLPKPKPRKKTAKKRIAASNPRGSRPIGSRAFSSKQSLDPSTFIADRLPPSLDDWLPEMAVQDSNISAPKNCEEPVLIRTGSSRGTRINASVPGLFRQPQFSEFLAMVTKRVTVTKKKSSRFGLDFS